MHLTLNYLVLKYTKVLLPYDLTWSGHLHKMANSIEMSCILGVVNKKQ